MFAKANPFGLFSVIVDLVSVFSRFKVEKLRFGVAVVTGRVVSIVIAI